MNFVTPPAENVVMTLSKEMYVCGMDDLLEREREVYGSSRAKLTCR